MTSLHAHDGDLHTIDGGHRSKPPREALEGLEGDARAAAVQRWQRRLQRHLAAHQSPPPAPRTVTPKSRAPLTYQQMVDATGAPLGATIRDELKARGIVQKEAAAWLDLTHKLFQDRLYGYARFTLAELAYLCRQLDIPMDRLLARLTRS